jgi:hypothetical protein
MEVVPWTNSIHHSYSSLNYNLALEIPPWVKKGKMGEYCVELETVEVPLLLCSIALAIRDFCASPINTCVVIF